MQHRAIVFSACCFLSLCLQVTSSSCNSTFQLEVCSDLSSTQPFSSPFCPCTSDPFLFANAVLHGKLLDVMIAKAHAMVIGLCPESHQCAKSENGLGTFLCIPCPYGTYCPQASFQPSNENTTKVSRCADNATFVDWVGLSCDKWRGFDCREASSMLSFPAIDQEQLIANCPRSCGACLLSSDLLEGGGYNVCPAGYYCPSPASVIDCPQGHFCPSGSVAPTPCQLKGFLCQNRSVSNLAPCPAGFYCPDTASIHVCPENHYCPENSISPKKCSAGNTCKEGSTSPNASSMGMTVVVVVLVVCVCVIIIQHAILTRTADKNAHILHVHHTATNLITEILHTIVGDDAFCYQFQGFQEITAPLEIELRNLSLVVKTGGSDEKKSVLVDIDAVFKPGQTTAIMGPSGCGKTSLISVLSNRLSSNTSVTGDVLINGQPQSVMSIKSKIGFVPQDDIVFTDLSVRENITFSAALRLSVDVSAEQRYNIVQDVLEVLQLAHVADSIVGGGTEARGVSGGQRKRVNIGMELAAAPTLLVLDEPTTGLDSSSSLLLAQALKSLTRLGMTILAVIHQPNYTTFAAFDNLCLLMNGGHTVYMGPTTKAIDYIESLGFEAPKLENPADFLLDVVGGQVPNNEHGPIFSHNSLAKLWVTNGEAFLLSLMDELHDGTMTSVSVTKSPENNQFDVESQNPATTTNTSLRPTSANTQIELTLFTGSQRFSSSKYINALSINDVFRKLVESNQDKDAVHNVIVNLSRHQKPISSKQFSNLQANISTIKSKSNHMFAGISQIPTINSDQLSKFLARLLHREVEIHEVDCLMMTIDPNNQGTIEASALVDLIKSRSQIISGKLDSEQVKPTHGPHKNHDRLPFASQLRVMIFRAFVQWGRSFNLLLFDAIACCIAGVVTGAAQGMNWKIELVAINLYVVVLGIGLVCTMSELRLFGRERLMFLREASSGISVPAYAISKLLVHLLDVAIRPVVYGSLYYSLVLPPISFDRFIFVVILIGWSQSGLGHLFSIALPPLAALLAGTVVPLVHGGGFAGVSPTIREAKDTGLIYIDALSFVRWAVDALVTDYVDGLPTHLRKLQGEPFLKLMGYQIGDYAVCCVALFVLGALARCATVGVLLWKAKSL